jgi:hypothetical protein
VQANNALLGAGRGVPKLGRHPLTTPWARAYYILGTPHLTSKKKVIPKNKILRNYL